MITNMFLAALMAAGLVAAPVAGPSKTGDCYPDSDLDGHGTVVGVQTGVTLPCPVGTVEVSDDCDDASGVTYPGSTHQSCDGVDYNCDGQVDATDEDGDGASPCTEPYAYPPFDCNDADPAVLQGAVEVPCDGVDNDCDGSTDDYSADSGSCPEPVDSHSDTDSCDPTIAGDCEAKEGAVSCNSVPVGMLEGPLVGGYFIILLWRRRRA